MVVRARRIAGKKRRVYLRLGLTAPAEARLSSLALLRHPSHRPYLRGRVDEKIQAGATVQKQVEAYNAHDLEAFAECYAVKLEISYIGQKIPPLRGLADLWKEYGAIFKNLNP